MARTQQKIRKTLLFRKLYNIFYIENTTRKGIMWVDVPNTCKSREEKDLILFDAINRLEQQIKIINNE